MRSETARGEGGAAGAARLVTVLDKEGLRRAATALGAASLPGDFYALYGEMGAGKTEFVRCLAKGLGVAETVVSPSFTIMLEYFGRLPLYHFDAYRISSEDELIDLGFNDYAQGDGVTALEWPSLVPGLLPDERLDICLSYAGESERRLEASGCSRLLCVLREAAK